MIVSLVRRLGSRRGVALVFAVALGAAASGCTTESGADPTIAQVTVDTDKSFNVIAGDGAGLFVEYAAGGHWTVFTACDSGKSETGAACTYEIFVTPAEGVAFASVVGADLGPTDAVALENDGAIHLQLATATNLGGVTFDATPGGGIQLDMTIDGASQPQLVQWISGAAIQRGAPSNPVGVSPTAP